MRGFILSILFLLTQSLFCQNFEAQVDQTKVGLHDTFEISFVLDDSGTNFSFSPPPDFQILRGPSKSSSTSIINGSLSQELTYTYVLKPKKIGIFTIAPASIKVKGKIIGSNTITMQVVKGSAPKKPNTPRNVVEKKVHLAVQADKKTAYVGEPIILTYTLYFNLNIGSLSPNSMKYTNFWANELDVNSETKKRKYKGQNYNAAIIKQVILTPQVAGVQSIDAYSVNLVASVPTGGHGFFVTNKNVDYTVVSNDLSLNILELPKEGRPPNFSGAIGSFDLSVNLDRDSIDINESVTYSVKINGKGNLNVINSPKVNFDTQLEVFEPKNLDRIQINQSGIQGYKKEEYLIVPRHKGVYNLQSVGFNFFNPKTTKYVSLLSRDMKIKVGGNQNSDDSYTLQTINKEQVDLINEDIKFIKTTYPSLFVKNNFSRSVLFYLLIIVAVLIFILAMLNKNKFIDVSLFFSKTVLQESLEKLAVADRHLKDKKYQAFQSVLLAVLFFYVSKKFSIKKSDLSLEKTQKVLVKNNISKELVDDYLELVKYLERCKYSPHDGDKINQDLYDRTLALLNKLD